MQPKYLFGDNYKECPSCKKSLPLDYPEEKCPSCMDHDLFNQIRDYIRDNDVNEHEVAAHFEIPLAKIRTWIREGRIEYKEGDHVISGQYCRRCGRTIFGGYFCPTCTRFLKQGSAHVMRTSDEIEAHRMHFIEREKSEEEKAWARNWKGKNK